MATRGWAQLGAVAATAGLIAAAAFGIATSTAPAGNRDPVPQVVCEPGPAEVNFGQNVACSASLLNNQNSMFTKVVYTHTIPTTILDGIVEKATLKYASCDPTLTLGTFTETDYSCPPTNLPAGLEAKVTLVWQTPSIEEPVTCDADAVPLPPSPVNDCTLTSAGQWTIKEGTGQPGSAGPDTFPEEPIVVTTSLIGDVQDPSKAGGYPLDFCTDPSTPTLTTNPSIGAGNPLTTSVCISGVAGLLLDPGLVIEILEGIGQFNPGITQTSDICIPAPGEACDDPDGYLPFPFDDVSTFIFVIDNRTLPKGEKIDQVFHNGVPVPFCSASPGADPCVLSIEVDNKLKITTVTCLASEQGGWDFG